MNPEVSVVIVNWNGIEFLPKFLKSLFSQTYRNFEVIFVDNASKDNSVDFVRKNFPKARIIQNRENKGFAEGNNTGTRKARGKFIALINTDTVLDKNWLGELVTAIKSDSKIATVSSAAYNKYITGDYKFFYGTSCFFGQNSIEDRIPKNNKKLSDIFGMAGGACILRNEKKPIFDPDYFLYSEDTAYGWLKRLQGYQNKINPKSTIFHEGEGSSKKIAGLKIFYQERNRLLNVFTFYHSLTFLKLLPLLMLNLLSVLLYDIKHIPFRLKAWLWLLFHTPTIIRKRRRIQSQRKVSDKEILRYMSCKFYEDKIVKNPFAKIFAILLNKIQYIYCFLLNIRTTEFFPISLG